MTTASEAGRWYDRSGNPVHEVAAKKGGLRNATLRDARKLDLVPSVTSILQIKAAPALDIWKQNQILDAALSIPVESDEGEWKRTVKEQAGKLASDAAEDGKRIHGYLEAHYRGEAVPQAGRPYVEGVSTLLEKECGTRQWSTERTFSHQHGFGGTADIYNSEYLLDFKTKDFGPDDPDPKGYDNHVMQLAAYRVGLGLDGARCANVFVSRGTPGHCSIYWWTEEELQRGWKMFCACLELWNLDRNYSGSW